MVRAPAGSLAGARTFLLLVPEMPPLEEAPSAGPAKKFPVLSVLVILLLLGIAVFGQRGLLRALQFNRQKATLEEKVHDLEASNAALRQEIEDLRSDRRTIEAIARRELGMVKDDEVVYQFRPALKKSEKKPEQKLP